MSLCVNNRLTCIAGTCRPSAYKRRLDAAIPKPARTTAFTEVACVPEDCIGALKVWSEMRKWKKSYDLDSTILILCQDTGSGTVMYLN